MVLTIQFNGAVLALFQTSSNLLASLGTKDGRLICNPSMRRCSPKRAMGLLRNHPPHSLVWMQLDGLVKQCLRVII